MYSGDLKTEKVIDYYVGNGCLCL
ncbi:hypothetical protein MNBD_GAMMA19-133 [hydrothermal vent metagenome]|uniref:Uncharacterized protein n=1 Tax=hydrothermal vent metagenome TaxID=652676 RepID=A0A3B1B9M8_9ZZZZ